MLIVKRYPISSDRVAIANYLSGYTDLWPAFGFFF